MRIREFAVKNFRSLKDVRLTQLQTVTLLLGENNSGKSNILEGMEWFFAGMSHDASQTGGQLTDDDYYLWFAGNSSEPIEFKVLLELSGDESKELRDELACPAKLETGAELLVERKITEVQGTWHRRNAHIMWGSGLHLRAQGGRYTVIPSYDLEVARFMGGLTARMRQAFTYIHLGREATAQRPHDIILDPTVSEAIARMGMEHSAPGIRRWAEWRNTRHTWLPQQLESRGNRLVAYPGNVPLLYELEGGGYQSALNILELFEKANGIVGIEEPENHLHPRLQKLLLDELTHRCGATRQAVIATHSPFVIDRARLDSAWYVYRDDLETKAVNVTTEDRLSDALWAMGVRPSDVLLADGVLVVEGECDRQVLCAWATLVGKPLRPDRVIVVDAEGFANVKKYVASQVIARTSFKKRMYCIVDENARERVAKAVEGFVPDENFLPLEQGDLEDYYPRSIVGAFAQEIASKKGKKSDDLAAEVPVGQTVATLNGLLGGGWWKRPLADKVQRETKPEDIPSEIVEKLATVHDATCE